METMRPQRRRFTIADGMILIAAMAAGMAWGGQTWKSFFTAIPTTVGSRAWFREWSTVALVMAIPCLLFLTIAAGFLRLRRPRPSWRRTTRQPGFTALLAAMFGLVLAIPPIVIVQDNSFKQRNLGNSFFHDSDFWANIPAAVLALLTFTTPAPAFAIIVAWVMLAVQRRWRSERSWIDRLGRALGVAWIIIGAFIGALEVAQLIL